MSGTLLVTGASGSIGREIAARGGAAGWHVLVHGRSEASAGAAAEDLRARVPGGAFEPVACDFLAEGAIAAMIGGIGRLDAIVNCAVSAPPGITGPFAGTDPAQYANLCLHAVATLQQLCHAALPLMAGGGSIVAMASDAGLFAAPNQSLIATTRAAIIAFCRNLALEVSREGVRVNCISTSFVAETDIFRAMVAAGSGRPETARKRAGLGLPEPADIAELALFLIGSGSRRLTGQVISVNGGLNA